MDKDAIKMINTDRSQQSILEDDEWRGMKKCCPIISGGLTQPY